MISNTDDLYNNIKFIIRLRAKRTSILLNSNQSFGRHGNGSLEVKCLTYEYLKVKHWKGLVIKPMTEAK